MKRTRRPYDRAFKISVVAELEGGKPPAQISHERGFDLPHVNIGSGKSWSLSLRVKN